MEDLSVGTSRLSIALLLAAGLVAGCVGDRGDGGEPRIACAYLDSATPPRPFAPSSFGHARGAVGTVYDVLPPGQSGGPLYLGGGFLLFDEFSTLRIARLNSLGTFDPGFDTEGFDWIVYALAPTDDGSGDIYVGGVFFNYEDEPVDSIVRLNCDGTLDTRFSTGSGGGLDNTVVSIVPVGDGSGDLYVGGLFSQYNGEPAKGIIRLNANGSRDPRFNAEVGGTVYAVAKASDGSGDVYIGGSFGVYRLNSDGSRDTGFQNLGFVHLDSIFNDVQALAIADDGSGDIYAAGNFSHYGGISSAYLVRIHPDGSRDAAFDVGTGFDTRVYALAPAGDGTGDVYVGGMFRTYKGSPASRFVRLVHTGDVHPAFASGTGVDNTVYAIRPAQDGSGAIYIAGDFTAYNGTGADHLARVNSDGSIDTSLSLPSRFSANVMTLLAANDGSGAVYAGGIFSYFNGAPSGGLARILPDGSLDSSFAVGTALGDGNNYVSVIVSTADGTGDLYVGGVFDSYNGVPSRGLARLNPDASLDPGFPVRDGIHWARAIAVAADGSGDIYVGGIIETYDGIEVNNIVRLNPDGSRDAEFSTGSGFDDDVYTIVPAADMSGDIYVSGVFRNYNGTPVGWLVRLDSDGALDPAFTVDPGLEFNGSAGHAAVIPVADGSGDIYVAGSFFDGMARRGLARLHSGGTINPAFDFRLPYYNERTAVELAADSSGDLILVGYCEGARSLLRVSMTGGLVSNYGGCGKKPGDVALAQARDGTGDVYVSASTYGDTSIGGLARIRPDGSLR